MKAFKKFVEDSGAYGPPVSISKKPVFRSSAIFPVIEKENFHSRILFMGYWILKREILEIGLSYTLRDEHGVILTRKVSTINSPKAFTVYVKDLLPNDLKNAQFIGSLELEVFSARDMGFPYPAFVLEYINDSFSTCVHTTGRVYNDIEDFDDNNDFTVAESGFDIYGGTQFDSFISFVNGPLSNSNTIPYEVINY